MLYFTSIEPPTKPMQNKILPKLVQNLDVLVGYWDNKENCTYANSTHCEWLGKSNEELIGNSLQDVLGPTYQQVHGQLRAAYTGERQEFEHEIKSTSGMVRIVLATYAPYVENGEIQGIFVHAIDISRFKSRENELRNAKNRAEHLATHDPLTGLPNRVLLLDRIEVAIFLADRNKEVLALVRIDIKEFRAYSDRYGHNAAEKLLVELSTRMKGSLRNSDTLTRLGDDQFILLAQGVKSRQMAEMVVERIASRISIPYQFGEENYIPSIITGIALYPDDASSVEELMGQSDQALKDEKDTSQNQLKLPHGNKINELINSEA